jgi:uncharacterized phage protein gp47/JayE
MPYQKSFDELFNAILTDYKNQFPAADTSQGSLIYIKSACLASALWGMYKYQEYISKQIFPDTADSGNLAHHGSIRNLVKVAGETDAEFLARLLEDLRRPPAGGNKYDYVKWAKSLDGVAQAYCFPIAQGLGTGDLVIVADLTATGAEVPSSSARSGVVTTVTAGKLIDSAASFNTGHAVAVGDVVRNTVQGTETTVLTVDSATQLTLADDIFKYTGENYHVHVHTGTNTTVTSSKLVDTAATFNDATYTIRKGDVVVNVTDNTETTVVSVDSATQLTLAADIFTATGKKYVVTGLIARVKEYIDGVRPVTASRVYVLVPTVLTQAVDMGVTPSTIDKAKVAADITAYINSLDPGQTLYLTQLTSIAIQNGASTAAVSVPAADVVPTAYQMVRPGTISVT